MYKPQLKTRLKYYWYLLLHQIRHEKSRTYFMRKYRQQVKRGVSISVWHKRRKQVLRRDKYTCQGPCGRKQKKGTNSPPLTVDHIVPTEKGGSSHIDNLQTLCRACHDEKDGKEKRDKTFRPFAVAFEKAGIDIHKR